MDAAGASVVDKVHLDEVLIDDALYGHAVPVTVGRKDGDTDKVGDQEGLRHEVLVGVWAIIYISVWEKSKQSQSLEEISKCPTDTSQKPTQEKVLLGV